MKARWWMRKEFRWATLGIFLADAGMLVFWPANSAPEKVRTFDAGENQNERSTLRGHIPRPGETLPHQEMAQDSDSLSFPIALPAGSVCNSYPGLRPDLTLDDQFADLLQLTSGERQRLDALLVGMLRQQAEIELRDAHLVDLPHGQQCLELPAGLESQALFSQNQTRVTEWIGSRRAAVFNELILEPLLGFPSSGVTRQLSLTEVSAGGTLTTNLEFRFLTAKSKLLFSYERATAAESRAASPDMARYAAVLNRFFPKVTFSTSP